MGAGWVPEVPVGSVWKVRISFAGQEVQFRRGEVLVVGNTLKNVGALCYDYVEVLLPRTGWLSPQIFMENMLYLERVA
jgi:hypothetical protein